VAEPVVDRLEPVEVEEHQHEVRAALADPAAELQPGRARERLLQAVGEQDPVRQARERVPHGQAGELALRALALDGVAHGPREDRRADGVLHQVVLRAGAHGLERHALVRLAGEDDDRDLGRDRAQAAQPLQALGVRQREVEQHEVRQAARQRVLRLLQPLAGSQHGAVAGLHEHLRHEAPVARVVLHEQHADGIAGHGERLEQGDRRHAVLRAGRRARRSQKPSSPRTIRPSSSRPIGLTRYAFAWRS